MNRRRFLKRSLIATPLVVGGTAAYSHWLERHNVEIVETEIAVGVPSPVSIAIIGDIHFDPLFEVDYLADVIGKVNSLSADLVLFTGDFTSRSSERLDELTSIIAGAEASRGRFAILGNHDHGRGRDELCAGLESIGIDLLRNESVPLPGCRNWYLTGLESYWSGAPNTRSLEATPADSRHLLLVHEPDSFDLLTDRRIALQLSGHTHGGQIRLPLIGAISLPTWGKKYQAGHYVRDGRQLYVNRGIGTVDEHFRLNCRPEITLLKLV